MPNYDPSGGQGRCRSGWGVKWTEIVLPASLVLVVSLPAMVVEEDWHGHPMIDQPNHLWIIPACLVATVFLVGGAFAGYRRPSTAVAYASASASVALAILLLGALFRRLRVVHEGVPIAVVRLWCVGVVGALVLSVIGSLLGRRLANGRR